MTDEIRVPTVEQIGRLEEAAEARAFAGASRYFKQAIAVAAYTGVRLGELLALEWKDVVADELQVTKQRRRDGGTSSTKNGHDRTTLILGPAREALNEILPDTWEEASKIDDRARIFDYSRREHTRVWGEVRRDAGLPEIRWHDLRHFYATHLIDMGASDLDVSLQLGHRDGGQLVRERYGHPSPARARDRLRSLTGGVPLMVRTAGTMEDPDPPPPSSRARYQQL